MGLQKRSWTSTGFIPWTHFQTLHFLLHPSYLNSLYILICLIWTFLDINGTVKLKTVVKSGKWLVFIFQGSWVTVMAALKCLSMEHLTHPCWKHHQSHYKTIICWRLNFSKTPLEKHCQRQHIHISGGEKQRGWWNLKGKIQEVC